MCAVQIHEWLSFRSGLLPALAESKLLEVSICLRNHQTDMECMASQLLTVWPMTPAHPMPSTMQLNAWLATRAFLVGTKITLADLLVFATVYRALVSGSDCSWCCHVT